MKISLLSVLLSSCLTVLSKSELHSDLIQRQLARNELVVTETSVVTTAAAAVSAVGVATTITTTRVDPQLERDSWWKTNQNNTTTAESVVVAGPREQDQKGQQQDKSSNCSSYDLLWNNVDDDDEAAKDKIQISEASYDQVSNSPGTTSTAGVVETENTTALPQQAEEQEQEDEKETVSVEVPTRTVVVKVDDDMFGSDLGITQTLGTDDAMKVQQRIEEARIYVRTTVHQDPLYKSVRESCQNKHELCAFWANLGECDKNPAYMKLNCAPVCQSCDQLDISIRCPMDPNATNAIDQPGDLDKLFYNLVTNPYFGTYEPKAVSFPAIFAEDLAKMRGVDVENEEGTSDDASVPPSDGPWLVVMENVVTPEEAWRLRELGAAQGYKRSEDVGKRRADGTYESYSNSGRTSTNAWCVNECYTDPIAQRVMQRIVNITGGIPETNSENLQLLKYEEGQFYRTHSDYIAFQQERQTGVRILTFYIYLNDVEEGGGTNFPHVANNITVSPKLGRAVLWPSVYNHDPNRQDSRTEHQALPVIKGIKFGANAWIHQRDYKGPNKIGC